MFWCSSGFGGCPTFPHHPVLCGPHPLLWLLFKAFFPFPASLLCDQTLKIFWLGFTTLCDPFLDHIFFGILFPSTLSLCFIFQRWLCFENWASWWLVPYFPHRVIESWCLWSILLTLVLWMETFRWRTADKVGFKTLPDLTTIPLPQSLPPVPWK